MKRRTFLTTAGVVAAASAFPAPAIAQGIRELKLVSTYPMTPFMKLLVRTITEAFGGRLSVKAFPAGKLVGAFEVFDAVGEGVADMYYSAEYFRKDVSPAFSFFAGVPFGLTSSEMEAWMQLGGGQELWDELSAETNIKPLLAGNTGVQMGGWYKKEISAIESFKGLRIRMPGLGGEIMRRMGAIPITVSPKEIGGAFRSGALDAAEWVGPGHDLRMGLHKVAKFYYYPGFHEPGTSSSLGINKGLWDNLSAEDRKLMEIAMAGFQTRYRAAIHVQQMETLPVLLEQHGVQLRKFDDEILRAFEKISGEVVAEVGASDPFTRRVYDSFIKFRKISRSWVDITERAYLNARTLDFPQGN